jgi:hypothetical protein
MNSTNRKTISNVAAILVLTILATLPAFAQSSSGHVANSSHAISSTHTAAEIKAPPASGRVNPATIRVNKRPPIPFRPFEMHDLRAKKPGEPVSPDQQITLANGKKMTLRQYLDHINILEKQLNTIGHSLRGPAKETKLQETVVPHALLQQQTQKVKAAHLSNTRSQPFNLPAAEQQHANLNLAKVDYDRLKNLQVFAPKKVHYDWGWDWGVGDPSTFATSVDIKLALDGVKSPTGSTASSDVTAEAKAGGALFGNSFDILRMTGNLHAADSGTMTAKLGIFVLGNSVYNLDKSTTAKFYKSDTVQKSLDKSVKVDFAIGPIPVSVAVGIQGTAGVGYAVTVAPVVAKVSGGPFVKSKAYAQFAVDLDIASAGVEGDLTLLDYGLNVDGEISFGLDVYSLKPYFRTEAKLSQNMKMLSGELDLFLEACVPCGDFGASCGFPFLSCTDRYTWILFKWDGFEYDGVLLNFTKNNYI